MNYHTLNQVLMTVVVIVLDVVTLLEQISIAYGTTYVVTDLADAFFPVQSVRKIRSSLLLKGRNNTDFNCLAPGLSLLSSIII